MVLLDFSMSPLGKGESVGPYVARCLEVVAASGLDYRLHAMGTTLEGEWDQVFGVVRMVLSVGEMSPIMPTPARINNQMAYPAERMRGRLRRSPEAKMIINIPFRRKVSVMIHPNGPSASPLGQSRGALGFHPIDSMKLRSRIVSAMRTLPNNSGPMIPA